MKVKIASNVKHLDIKTKEVLDEHAPCEDTMRNAENYFEYKRAKTSLDSFIFEMEKLQLRFETFEKAISQFEPLSQNIIVSQLKVLKSTPSLDDVKNLNYLLDEIAMPGNTTKVGDNYGKYSAEFDYDFKALHGTEMHEKFKKEYEENNDEEEGPPF